MAADTQYGVDPQGQPQPMPPDQQQVDPNSPPPDPMLAGPEAVDPSEFQTRERVELQLLLSIEKCARAVEVGVGAENPQFVQAFGQASQSLALAYASLAGIEQKEATPANPQGGSFGPWQSASPASPNQSGA